MPSAPEIVKLIAVMAEATGRTTSTVSRLASGSGATYRRLCGNPRANPPVPARDITTRRAARILRWISDHWPPGTDWPADVPRPDPSPASRPPGAPGGDPVASVREAKERLMQGMVPGNKAARRKAEHEMHQAALQLGPDGQVLSVDALCIAFGIGRATVDTTVSRYRDGRSRRWPAPGSDAERALLALVAAGDVRFASRRGEGDA